MTFQELSDKWGLLDRYGKPFTVSGSPVGKGWIPLLDRLFAALVARGWNRQVDHFKEKFGGLRVGLPLEDADPALFDLVWDAEEDSFSVCENCGQEGRIVKTRPWVKTLCTPCGELWGRHELDMST